MKQVGFSVGLPLLLLCLGTLALVPLANTNEHVREITLVARGVTFYVDGRPEPNPTLRVKAGEQVRFSFRNEDPGMAHNFAVSAWSLDRAFPLAVNETSSVVVRVPEQPGRYPYVCTPHAALMRGAIEVE